MASACEQVTQAIRSGVDFCVIEPLLQFATLRYKTALNRLRQFDAKTDDPLILTLPITKASSKFHCNNYPLIGHNIISKWGNFVCFTQYIFDSPTKEITIIRENQGALKVYHSIQPSTQPTDIIRRENRVNDKRALENFMSNAAFTINACLDNQKCNSAPKRQ